MRRCLFFVFAMIFFAGSSSFAQKYSKSRQAEKTGCIISKDPKKYNGLGFKIGDPIALTYKANLLRYLSFEVTGGIPMGGKNDDYVREAFFKDPDLQMNEYVSHDIVYSYAFQGRVLFKQQIKSSKKYVEWFTGIGVQYRSINVNYKFNGVSGVNKDNLTSGNSEVTDIGPELVAGVEYVLSDLPISAFGEIGVFSKMNEDVRWIKPIGGIGIRFIF